MYIYVCASLVVGGVLGLDAYMYVRESGGEGRCAVCAHDAIWSMLL